MRYDDTRKCVPDLSNVYKTVSRIYRIQKDNYDSKLERNSHSQSKITTPGSLGGI